jgi:hypothetical protein
VHYNLGYLFQTDTPPDIADMTSQWQQVIQIDPNSPLAKKVATQLK